MGVSWGEFEAAAPELAAAVESRFVAHIHHILGTLRRDGAPRLSGTEVEVKDGRIGVGMMPGSRKLEDVRRDPRVELHSAPLEPDLAGGDAKVAGRLCERASSAGTGVSLELEIERVSLVRVDGDELEITTWGPEQGLRTVRRR
jgi:hypothetical protein